MEGARFVVVAVDAMPLPRARDENWQNEGMSSPEAFEAAWRDNHPTRGWRETDSVWVHRFRRA